MQQDAHEFLNFLINHINEIILGKPHVITILLNFIYYILFEQKIIKVIFT